MQRILASFYGLAVYVVFPGAILYAIGFVKGLVVAKTIDTGSIAPIGEAVVLNILLLALFAARHSQNPSSGGGGNSCRP